MFNKVLIRLFIATVTLGTVACGTKVTRVDVEEQVDLSGRWNDTDSRLTASELVGDVLTAPWLSNFTQDNGGKKPVVIAGMVTNKSHEHISAETFVKDIEKSFISSQKVRLVQGGAKREEIRGERASQQNYSSQSTMKNWGLEVGADYMMQGTLNSIVDSKGKQKVIYYQIDMELTDLETNEVVWIGDKKIKKVVKN